ncbi:putative P450 monooxygenase [Hortaea werneckii]|uniref:Uncharacterized protein n=1 Tax=Hortaea werneckii TaxID=91943 RepID=A0A3M7CMN0_HORWE|nr:putative P450 monooxygenase [Hortaea werneckii]KAI7717049.1 putative P450 monooxygenase [Hortaea werneckii]RMY53322.1 hypothetical protein D0865_05307 [Hortaea werneckii]
MAGFLSSTTGISQFSPPLLASCAAALLLCYLLIGAWVNHRKLRQFKGPLWASCSRSWIFWHECNARLNKAQFDAIRQYGSPCRIGPTLLITDDADVVRHMNAPASQWRRSGWYDGMRLDPRLDSVFSTRDEKHHAELRAKESGGYNGRDIATLEPDIDSRINDVLALIRDRYSNRKTMDIALISRFFTLDVLSTIAFGRPFGFMEANDDLWDYVKSTSSAMFMLTLVVNHSSVRWLFHSRIMQALGAPKVTDKTGMGPMLAFARKAVAERFGSKPVVKQDMLGHFINKGLSQVQCEAEAALQIIAGSDSTTTILQCTMFLLVGTPAAYAKLKDELDQAEKAGTMSGSDIIKYAETQKLQYLQAVIWEGIRLFPPLFGLKAKLAPKGGDTINGVYYPEGTEMAICDAALCQNPAVFGSDAHLFRPERWIEADAATKVKYRQTVDSIFGSGRFLCLGRHIAMMELHKTIAELVRHFDFAMADPMRGIDTHAHSVHLQSNMNLVATPRI